MIALWILVLAQGALARDACAAGADVAIESVRPEKLESTGGVTTYLIHISVLNRGGHAQSPKARQVVVTYRDEDRIARTNVPALGANEAYAFTTKFKRSSEAGRNSTSLLLRLGGLNYAPGGAQDCNERNNSFRLTF